MHTDSGRYVQLIAQQRFEDAFLVARSPNPLASICGRVCAAPCEDACRRRWIDEPVTIRPLKRFVTEQFGAESATPNKFQILAEETDDDGCRRAWHIPQLRRARLRGKHRKVAIIGSGPAGIACAHDLALMEYDVTVFEALERPGGMLRYGIPEYRLPRGVIDREIAAVEAMGVTIRCNSPITSDFHIGTLRGQGFEAFFIAVGAMQGRDLNIPGHDKDGVIKAVDYLLNLNRGYQVDLGKKVVVIGGGSVAIDAARTAVREFYQPMEEIEMTADAVVGQPAMDAARGALRSGTEEVRVVSLESMDELPAAKTIQSQDELREGVEEGIQLMPSWGPKRILGDGSVTGIELVAVTRVFDDEGRFNPQYDETKTQTFETNSVILAVGQTSDFSFLRADDGVELTRTGALKIDPSTLATTAKGIFGGGDAAFGPRIAIEAVANGKRAAQSIHDYLTGGRTSIRVSATIDRLPNENYKMFEGYEKAERSTPPTIESGRRTGITEVEQVFTANDASIQAERCLNCHVDTIYDPELCVLCGRCADVCPENCLLFVPIEEVDMPAEQKQHALEHYQYTDRQPLTVLIKDDTACIRCGLCALRCPTDAMTMERFDFVEECL